MPKPPQARTSAADGLEWMGRLPRGADIHLKCFTALVRYVRLRSMPALPST